MKSKAIATALALSLGFGTLAQAQVQGDYYGPTHVQPGPQDQGQPPQYYAPAQDAQRWQGQGHRQYGEAHPYPYGNDPRQYPGQWREREREHYYRGGYAPDQYRSQRYWVRDWRERHLAPPPQGYQWVETDTGDVLLIALATGLIASVLLNQR